MSASRQCIVAATLLMLGSVVAGGAACHGGSGQQQVGEASQADVLAAIETSQAPLLLDVRTPEEFASGHVPGARNIPIDELASRQDELAAFREREIVVYCETGRRSAKASDALTSAGFTRVRHLDGDMAAWRDAALPVE